ncbi:MAG TPA: DMT family transporter [Thermoanaerobaculia bacterium]
MNRRIAADAAVAVLLFGTIPVTVRSIEANPWTIGIFRLLVATTAVGIFLAFSGQLRRIAARDAARLVIIGAFFFTHWITLFFAIKASSASVAAIGQSTYGIDLLLLAAIFTRHRIHASDVTAVCVAAAGAVLVVPAFNFSNDVTSGLALACLSALFYAALPLLHQRWSHIPNGTRTFGQFAVALLLFLSFAGRADWNLEARDWAGLLYLAIAVTVLGHSLWVRVTTRVPSRITSIIYYANIPFAVLLGVLLLDEPLSGRMAIGAAMIIGGSVYGLAAARSLPE